MRSTKVKGIHMDKDGDIVGTYHDNPFLNSILYDVEFPYGAVKQYAENVISENMYAQCDQEGNTVMFLDSIIDYSSDKTAIKKKDKYVYTEYGKKRLRQNTAGWKLLVRYIDGSEHWVPLKSMKEHFPVQTAEFAKSRNIHNEPSFAYWFPFTLRKRDRIK